MSDGLTVGEYIQKPFRRNPKLCNACGYNYAVAVTERETGCPKCGDDGTRTPRELIAAERDRCLAVANDVLTRGPGMPCSSEFADGYSLAAQEIAAGIGKPAEPGEQEQE